VIEQRLDPTADVNAVILHERATSSSLGGRALSARPRRQLDLFSNGIS